MCQGLAHLLEHMAFKGTTRIGTTDARREAVLLDALDECALSFAATCCPVAHKWNLDDARVVLSCCSVV